MRHLLAAKSEVQQVKGFMPVELMETLIRANGYEVAEHRSWRFRRSMRAPGESRSQSIPDFGDFDSTRRFLLNDSTRVMLLQQCDPTHPFKWRCELQFRRTNVSDTIAGVGHGNSPAFALCAAWLDLQAARYDHPRG